MTMLKYAAFGPETQNRGTVLWGWQAATIKDVFFQAFKDNL